MGSFDLRPMHNVIYGQAWMEPARRRVMPGRPSALALRLGTPRSGRLVSADLAIWVRADQMKIELLRFDDCPNRCNAETILREVISELGVNDPITRIEVPDAETGRRVRFPGSPTIRIDGKNVEPGFVPDGEFNLRCRLCSTASGFSGLPERAWLVEAVSAGMGGPG